MLDPSLKRTTGTEDDFRSISPDDLVPEWENIDFCLPAATEDCTVSPACRVAVFHDPTGAGADRFHLAQIRLKSIQASRRLKSILITSPLPGDGKTTVSLNLATVLAEHGKVPVLLVEADVYRPEIVKRLGLKPWAGLMECSRRGEDPMLSIRRINPLGFNLLPAGQRFEDDPNVLQSTFTAQLIKSLSASSFSWVLIDAPPTTPIADVLALNAHADATLLVARAGRTPREAIEESARNLGRDHVLGLFLNGIEGLNKVYSKYYGYKKTDAQLQSPEKKTGNGLGLSKLAK